MQGDANEHPRFRFSREIRLGDLVTVFGVLIGTAAAMQRMDFRVDVLERANAAQAHTNTEMKAEIREVSLTVGREMKEQGQAIRRIESKLDRARM